MSTVTDSRIGAFTTDWDEILERLADLWPYPTDDELETAMMWVGRVNAPALMWDLAYAGYGDGGPEMITGVVHSMWTDCEYPEDTLEPADWRELFRLAGYRVDGVPAERPETVTLYRGAPDSRVERMSWSSSREVAERFAWGMLRGRETGHLWRAEVTGDDLLAQINGREEHEYVLDPARLETIIGSAVKIR